MVAWLVAVAAVVAFSWRYAWWRPVVDSRRPRILMYHMVSNFVPGARFNGLRVRPDRFEAQLAWMKARGYTFYTVSRLWDEWNDLPDKAVAITFDDGYADNLVHALPLLEKYDACATLYLVVDRHERDWSTAKKAHHDSGELARERKLSDEEVRIMLASGRFELASHTLTHINMPATPIENKRHELMESKRLLEEAFSVPIRSFAYPFGLWGEGDAVLVRESGYDTAVTTVDGIDTHDPRPDPMRLQRIKVSGKDNLLAFSLRLRSGRRGANK